MKEYYPQYYRRRKRRERILDILSFGFATLAAGVLAWFIVAWLTNIFLVQTNPQKRLAEEVKRVEAKPVKKEEGRVKVLVPKRPVEEQKILAQDEIQEYEKGFPQINIALAIPEKEEPKEQPTLEDEGKPSEVRPETPTKPKEPPKTERSKEETRSESTREEPKREEKPVKREESKPKSNGGTRYVYKVYAGKWDSLETAEEKRKELSGRGISGSIVNQRELDREVYFVLVDQRFEDETLASRFIQNLREKGFPDAILTRAKVKD